MVMPLVFFGGRLRLASRAITPISTTDGAPLPGAGRPAGRSSTPPVGTAPLVDKEGSRRVKVGRTSGVVTPRAAPRHVAVLTRRPLGT